MDKIPPPKPLSHEGNVMANWRWWKKDIGFYMDAIGADEKVDKIKIGIFLTCIGPKGREIFDTLRFDSDGDDKKYEKVLEKFEADLVPRKNITYSRYEFFTYRQKEGQPFNKYHTDMKKLCTDSELGTLDSDLLRDMLVIGLIDKRLQERLLRDTTLTLEKVVTTCKNAELTHKQAKAMQQNNLAESNVDTVCKPTSFDNSKKLFLTL